jgi:hypothetical protein
VCGGDGAAALSLGVLVLVLVMVHALLSLLAVTLKARQEFVPLLPRRVVERLGPGDDRYRRPRRRRLKLV